MSSESTDFGYREIDSVEAQELIRSTPNLTIIDVRDEEKYGLAHVPGAKRIALNDILADPMGTIPEGAVLFVCNVGQMSGVASQMAVAVGRQNVYNLSDGTKGWMQQGYRVEGLLAGSKTG